MSSIGAKSLILVSRSGIDTAGEAKAAEALRKLDVTVTVRKCDVSDAKSIPAVLDDCVESLPLIRGVIQGAMVLKVRHAMAMILVV